MIFLRLFCNLHSIRFRTTLVDVLGQMASLFERARVLSYCRSFLPTLPFLFFAETEPRDLAVTLGHPGVSLGSHNNPGQHSFKAGFTVWQGCQPL